MSEPSKPSGSPGCAIAVCVVLALVVGALLLPTMGHPPEASHLSSCKNNLKQLGLALHNYHDKFQSFPPAIVRDENARPHISWRTILLPYAEASVLYEKYKLNEPWDSPHNKALMQSSIEVFRCPSNKTDFGKPTTNYVAVIGPNTAWRSDGTVVSVKDFTDGVSNTILLVETKEAGIHLFEPRDLSLDQMILSINSPVGQGISSDHRIKTQSLGIHVLMADGTVWRLPDKTPPEVIHALLTINGGEKIIQDDEGWRVAP